MVSLPEEIVAFLEAGPSLLVGTVDGQGMPQVARAVGALVARDRQHFTLFLPECPAAPALANLAQVPHVAVTASEPISHRTVQIKGDVLALRAPDARERAWVETYPSRLADALAQIGLARAVTRQLHCWPARAVEIAVRAIFDQTPGPGAGRPLGAERAR
jgi:hypothetical protein